MNISQSLIKDWYTHKKNEECGLRFKAKHIDKIAFPSSDIMRLGCWFEYMCTGALLRDGSTPEPDVTKKGDLTAPYQKMLEQSIRFKKACQFYNIEILETGKVIEAEFNGYNHKGILDVYGTMNGKQCIIDIKSTGYLHNGYEDMGWEERKLEFKDKLMFQPIEYKRIWKANTGEDIDFFFFVHSNTNEIESAIFEIDVSDSRMEKHISIVSEYIEEIEDCKLLGFKPIPSVKVCEECPVKECPSRITVPKIKKIYLL